MPILILQDIQKIAAIRKGKCLSKEFINSSTKMSWMCLKGHTWDAPYSIIKQGGWCRQCAKNDAKLDIIRELAQNNRGVCISDEYQKSGKYQFRCSASHTFFLNSNSLKAGSWCILCYRESERIKEFATLKKIIQKKGGDLLSNSYSNKNSYVKIDCGKGHEWKVKASRIKKGLWCPECERNNICEQELRKLNEIANKKGGRCLSDSFLRIDKKLKWQCKEGHIFSSTPKIIKKGSWCKICSNKGKSEKQWKYDIDYLRKLAKKNGGELLSTEYKGTQSHLEWKCSKGHIWKATPAPMIYHNRWCQICAIDKKRLPIDEFHKIALSHNGKLLSEKYINNSTKLKWQCEKGHKWLAAPVNIRNGSWCPICADRHYRLTIDVLHKEAAKNGGKLLSPKYLGMETKLKWKCKRDHVFMTTPHLVRSGSWCRKCADENQRDSVDVFQKIAKEKGGKMLSKVHTNSTTPLEFVCKQGHVWKAWPSTIKKGSWCRLCAARERGATLRYSISDFQKYAKKRGGKLLTKEYINKDETPLIWKCSQGHVWTTHGSGILTKKSWCRECAINNRKALKN